MRLTDLAHLVLMLAASEGGEFAYAGRRISPGQHATDGGWPNVLHQAPTVWERFRLVAA